MKQWAQCFTLSILYLIQCELSAATELNVFKDIVKLMNASVVGQSISPTVLPSAIPTVIPTTLPSTTLTKAPSQIPSRLPTLQPSPAPTLQQFPIVYFTATIRIKGLPSTSLSQISMLCFQNSTAQAMSLKLSNVDVNQQPRRLRIEESNIRQPFQRQLIGIFSLPMSIHVSMEPYSNLNSTSLYQRLLKALNTSVTTGGYTSYLQAISKKLGSSETVAASAVSVIFSPVGVLSVPTQSPTLKVPTPPTSKKINPAIILVIIALCLLILVFGFIRLLCCGMYYGGARRNLSRTRAATIETPIDDEPTGYVGVRTVIDFRQDPSGVANPPFKDPNGNDEDFVWATEVMVMNDNDDLPGRSGRGISEGNHDHQEEQKTDDSAWGQFSSFFTSALDPFVRTDNLSRGSQSAPSRPIPVRDFSSQQL